MGKSLEDWESGLEKVKWRYLWEFLFLAQPENQSAKTQNGGKRDRGPRVGKLFSEWERLKEEVLYFRV